MIKTYTVKVRATHIDEGRPNVTRGCPVFLARSDAGMPILAAYSNAPLLSGEGFANSYLGGHWPPEVRDRIRVFDKTGEMEPFTFTYTV